MKKIRIAHIINFLSPAGKEVGIVKLLNGMDEERFEGYLIVIDKVIDPLFLDQKKTKLLSLNKKPGNDVGLPFRLASILRKEKIDIVHTHAWGTLVEGILGAKMARVPVIIHGEHGTFHTDAKRKLIQRLFFNLADYLLSVSQVLADRLHEVIGPRKKRFTSILNGVDTGRFYPNEQKRIQQRKVLGVAPDTVLIGTVGRTVPVKNHQLLIKAAALLHNTHTNFKICIVGGIDAEKKVRMECERLADELDVASFVDFVGVQDDIPAFLNAFDIFVLPSLSEGCSNVIQEAMACGKPVVASNVGGNSELVMHQKTGLLFPSNDETALYKALTILVDDDRLRENFGRNALEQIRSSFSLAQMIKSYQNFYLTSLEVKPNEQ